VAAQGESEIYRELMRFKPEELSPNAWAVKAGVSRTVWTDMRRHGNPSRRTLEKLLTAAGSSLAEFEALRVGPQSRGAAIAGATFADAHRDWAPATPPRLPLIATSLGAEWAEPGSGVEVTEIRSDEVLERLPRPASLAGDPEAFAVTIVGTSMWPRFRTGARVAVSPRAPVAIGDDVLVRLRSSGGYPEDMERALLMQLAKRAGNSFELRQFNPDKAIRVDTDHVHAVSKIVGELI
jgi:phage repressor protein C with HTH and peptisase S24 domain